ncbi:MAG: prepilin-type N-terminal cleavage/methylation domain-containing protein, partial [Mollicutes bacterium]|nr:prepilin-type N-terminal cleavage/methylation domain-containing protein [Mollicutes bacterium]
MYEKKGFTLVEMLGVIVVLGLLLVLAVPTIINQIKNTSGEVDEATQQLIFNSAKQFIDQNSSLYPTESGYVYCISLNTLVNNGLLIDNLIDFKTGQKMDLDKVVKIDIENESNIDYSIIKASECTEKRPTYVDGSGANPPVLVTGMTPIKWDVIEWEDTVNYDSEWYDYNQKKWANVKTEDGSMWVWIPRYAYKITDCFHSDCSGDAGNIEIKFLKGTTNETADGKVVETSGYSFGEKDTSTHYFLHPAFTFGDEEIPGFWVAKFEASGSADDINILPNVSSLRNMTIGDQFDAAFNMRNNSKYGWSEAEVDTHMMKN